MRASRKCTFTKIERLGSVLRVRTCMLARKHAGLCLDAHGRWQSTTEESK